MQIYRFRLHLDVKIKYMQRAAYSIDFPANIILFKSPDISRPFHFNISFLACRRLKQFDDTNTKHATFTVSNINHLSYKSV